MFTTRTTRNIVRIATVTTLGLAGVVGACSSDDSTTATSTVAATEAAPAATTTPIGGSLTGSFEVSGCLSEGETETPVAIDATGDLGELGAVTLHVDETALCSTPGLLDSITAVTGTYTTSNGDELTFTGTGSTIEFDMENNSASYSSDDEFTGGTGRFADVTGRIHVEASHSFDDLVLTLVLSGEVTTVG